MIRDADLANESITTSPQREDAPSILSDSLELSSLYSSGYTVSSGSTEWGPGSLSGKAIRALGSFVLRASDRLTIQRRISTINVRLLTPDERRHSRSDSGFGSISRESRIPFMSVEEREKDWEDVLELSRRGLYNDTVRRQALYIILARIQRDNGRCPLLMTELLKWPEVEIEIFFSELMACLPDDRLAPLQREKFHESIRHDLMASETVVRNRGLTTAFASFTTDLLSSGSGPTIARAIIEAGFLRLITLLAISTEMLPFLFAVSDDRPQLRNTFESKFFLHYNGCLTLRECQRTLIALADQRNAVYSVEVHPFALFWPWDQLQPTSLHCLSQSSRSSLLALLPMDIRRLRLDAIDSVIEMSSAGYHLKSSSMFLVLGDLLVLLRDNDISIVHQATAALLKLVALGTTFWDLFNDFSNACSDADICLLIDSMIVGIRIWESVFQIYKAMVQRDKEVDPIDYFFEFCTTLCSDNRRHARFLIKSGISGVLMNALFEIFPELDSEDFVRTPLALTQKRHSLRNEISKVYQFLGHNYHQANVYDHDLSQVATIAYCAVLSVSVIQDLDDSPAEVFITKNRALDFLNTSFQDVETWILLGGDTLHDSKRILILYQLLMALCRVHSVSSATGGGQTDSAAIVL